MSTVTVQKLQEINGAEGCWRKPCGERGQGRGIRNNLEEGLFRGKKLGQERHKWFRDT